MGELLAGYRFDYLLGSVHCVFGVMPRRALEERGYSPDEVYREYFAEVRALLATGLPHCLGHLDYVHKTCGDLLGSYIYPDYERDVADIVARLAAAGIALEVNTRHYGRQPVVPPLDVLRMYYAAGGRRVTMGSDAHAAGEVGRGLGEACRRLREAGFTEYLAFENGRATAHPLPDPGEGP